MIETITFKNFSSLIENKCLLYLSDQIHNVYCGIRLNQRIK
jgi:hypothetical protein